MSDRSVNIQRAVLQSSSVTLSTVQRNKRSGLRYERFILPKLGARRVPSSGAGVIKGDGVLSTSYGLALIECKYQSSIKRSREVKDFSISIGWLEKIIDDVIDMRYASGFLVFHSGSSSYHYAALPERYVSRLFPTPPAIYYRFTGVGRSIDFLPDIDFEPVCRFGSVFVSHPSVSFLVFDAFLFVNYLTSA